MLAVSAMEMISGLQESFFSQFRSPRLESRKNHKSVVANKNLHFPYFLKLGPWLLWVSLPSSGEGSELGDEFFKSVPHSMPGFSLSHNSLLAAKLHCWLQDSNDPSMWICD